MTESIINQPTMAFEDNNSAQWPPASQALDFAAFEALVKANPAMRRGQGSAAWKINGERIMTLGWGRAVLMQIAHPAVACGVAQHSHFSKSPTAKITRFQRTLNRMLEMTFGTPREAWEAAHKIDTIHGRVNGQLQTTGERYTARDPELLKWVNATFTDSMLKTYELFIAPLSVAEKNEYVLQASFTAPMLGAPLGFFPTTLPELNNYMNEVLQSGTLQVNQQTRRLADYVLEGLDIPLIGLGLNWYGRLTVAGLLPSSLRAAYNLKWGRFEATALKSAAWTHRRLHPTLPPNLRRWEIALQAESTAAKTAA